MQYLRGSKEVKTKLLKPVMGKLHNKLMPDRLFSIAFSCAAHFGCCLVPISFLLSSYLLPFLFYFVFICCCEPMGLLSVCLHGSLHAVVVHSIPHHIACEQVVKSQWCERGHGDRAGWVCKAYVLLPEGQLLYCLSPVATPAREKAEPGKVPAFWHTAQHLQ